MGQKLGHKAKMKGILVNAVEAACFASAAEDLVRFVILLNDI